jgi:hypothetical protein
MSHIMHHRPLGPQAARHAKDVKSPTLCGRKAPGLRHNRLCCNGFPNALQSDGQLALDQLGREPKEREA